jgi:putative methyltransferase (TIGR04325 family)
MLRIKRTLKPLLPPIVVEGLRRLRPRAAADSANVAASCHDAASTDDSPPHWEMVPNNNAAWAGHEGWGHASIVETQRAKWDTFMLSVAKPQPLGQSHEGTTGGPPDVATHNTIMTFGYVLGRVAGRRDGVSILDWGGGLGHYYVYARELFPDVAWDYVIKDMPGLCAAGQRLLPKVKFVADDGEALSRRYDLVFASSSVHYARDHYTLIDRLCESARGWLMITRVPMIRHHDDFVVVQRPHIYGYMTEYAGWFMNRTRFVDHVTSRSFVLEREFAVGEAAHVPNAPEHGQYAGFLFRRAGSSAVGAP